jgi:hypothetical protein
MKARDGESGVLIPTGLLVTKILESVAAGRVGADVIAIITKR